MEPTIDPMVLGPLMIVLTTAWFGGLSWAGMHEDETPRRRADGSPTGDGAAPWWTNRGFGDPVPDTIQTRTGTSSTARHAGTWSR